jgi:hypothetical protein
VLLGAEFNAELERGRRIEGGHPEAGHTEALELEPARRTREDTEQRKLVGDGMLPTLDCMDVESSGSPLSTSIPASVIREAATMKDVRPLAFDGRSFC